MSHDAHVIEKRRHGGDRHGQVAYYAVGPTRPRLSEAMDDMETLVAPDARTEALDDEVASLQESLLEGRELLETTRRELADERARGAALVSRIREAKARIEEMGGYSSDVMEEIGGIEYELGDAVQALLELAKAAEEAPWEQLPDLCHARGPVAQRLIDHLYKLRDAVNRRREVANA